MCNRIEKLSEANRIKQNSKRVQKRPVPHFKKNLRFFFMGFEREETLSQFQDQLSLAAWHSEDLLHCIKLILRDPPDNLVEIMDLNGAGGHDEVEGKSETQVYMDYLKEIEKDLTVIFQEHPCRVWYPESFTPLWPPL